MVYRAVYPPSTGRRMPVTQLASSLASTTASLAISSGQPGPLKGCLRLRSSQGVIYEVVSLKMAVCVSMWTISINISRGLVMRKHTSRTDGIDVDTMRCVVQRDLFGQVADSTFRRAVRRYFAGEEGIKSVPHMVYRGGIRLYLRLSSPATIPIIEDMLIIQPRSPEECGGCFNIWAVAYLQPKNTDLTLTRIVVSQTSSSVKWHTAGVLASSPTPALLTKLSLPKVNGTV